MSDTQPSQRSAIKTPYEAKHLPAHLTDLAIWTLPASSDNWIDLNRWVETVTMVMMTTTCTKQLFMYISNNVTYNTESFFTSWNRLTIVNISKKCDLKL